MEALKFHDITKARVGDIVRINGYTEKQYLGTVKSLQNKQVTVKWSVGSTAEQTNGQEIYDETNSHYYFLRERKPIIVVNR